MDEDRVTRIWERKAGQVGRNKGATGVTTRQADGSGTGERN